MPFSFLVRKNRDSRAPEFTMLYEDSYIAVCHGVCAAAVCVLVLVLFLGIFPSALQKCEHIASQGKPLHDGTKKRGLVNKAWSANRQKEGQKAENRPRLPQVAAENVRAAVEGKVKAEKANAPEKGTREGKDNRRAPFPAFSRAGCHLFAR